jgi:hypothetical protein
MSKLADWAPLKKIFVSIQQMELLDLALVATLIVLLLYGPSEWYVRVPVAMLSIGGLLSVGLRSRRTYWTVLASLLLTYNAIHWFSADNHKHLMAYWCVALACGLYTARVQIAVATSARWLIGLAFLFAIAWRVISKDFADSAFFHHTLLTDERFRNVTRLLGGLPAAAFDANASAIDQMAGWRAATDTAALQTTPRITSISGLMTYWTFAVESSVAATFLCPRSLRLSKLRDVALICFCVTTYAIAPVLGFGSLLLAMGLSQTDGGRAVRIAYLAAFLLLQSFVTPWSKVGETWLWGASSVERDR